MGASYRLAGKFAGKRPEIRDWVLADDPAWPFSFVNAYTTVGVDAGRLRAELGAWLAVDASRPA